MSKEDFQALRAPLLLLLTVLIAGGVAIYYTDGLTKASRNALAKQEKELKDARTRLQKSGEEKDVIVRYLDSYRQLERAGFIGEEQRINWLDGLRLANQQADLFGVGYQIGTQSPYTYSAYYNPGQIALSQSIMRLDFRLLHEGDLTRFLDALSRQGGGLFTVEQCSLKRIDTRGVIRYQPNINADCDLAWITAKVSPTPSQQQQPQQQQPRS
jgi:hypothetical protein